MLSLIESLPAFTYGFAQSYVVCGFERVLKLVDSGNGLATPIVLRNSSDFSLYDLHFQCLSERCDFNLDHHGNYVGTFNGQGGFTVHIFAKAEKRS